MNEKDNNVSLLSDIGNCALESIENVGKDDDENDCNNNGNNNGNNDCKNGGIKNDCENNSENDDEYMDEKYLIELLNNSPN